MSYELISTICNLDCFILFLSGTRSEVSAVTLTQRSANCVTRCRRTGI